MLWMFDVPNCVNVCLMDKSDCQRYQAIHAVHYPKQSGTLSRSSLAQNSHVSELMSAYLPDCVGQEEEVVSLQDSTERRQPRCMQSHQIED